MSYSHIYMYVYMHMYICINMLFTYSYSFNLPSIIYLYKCAYIISVQLNGFLQTQNTQVTRTYVK